MPEISGSQPDHVARFEDLLNDAAREEPGLNVNDLDTMSIVIFIRLRSIFTTEQLHERAHMLIAQAEDWIKEPGSLRGEDGEPSSPVLVENFSDREDLLEMMDASRKDLDDDEIAEFLEGETA